MCKSTNHGDRFKLICVFHMACLMALLVVGKIIDIVYSKFGGPEMHYQLLLWFNLIVTEVLLLLKKNPKLSFFSVERKIECSCNCCVTKHIPFKFGCATTIYKCKGVTIGKGKYFDYIIINLSSKSFESRYRGALFIALSRSKFAGNRNCEPDFP